MIKTYQDYIKAGHETGQILSSQGFSATAQGIPSVAVGELVMTSSGGLAIVNALAEDTTELLMIDRGSSAKGEPVVAVGEVLSVPCGDKLFGRTVTPVGDVLDGGEPLGEMVMEPLEKEAPPIYMRAKIVDQLLTGVMLEDLLVPLGRGQREVVMGDAKSGKTSFLMQILMHVEEQNMVGIYVGIGKTRAEMRRVSTMLTQNSKKVIVVATSSSDSTTLQYLAPYAGMTMAEYYRDKGQDVFLVLDDLGNHAKAYREISLLNNRLPGRDSYPGDIFYTHSRLLERAGSVAGADGRGHTITLMPIIETIGGDVTGYVQTNLISMSDGHTLFDLETFYKGIRPAINIGLSVSRVGKQTQTKLQKFVASELRSMIAQYKEAQNFVRFGAELTDKTKQLFQKGTIFEELIKQDLNTHLNFEEQLIVMLGLLGGYFDEYSLKDVLKVRASMLKLFKDPQYDPLRKALHESAKEEERKPLQDQFYQAAKAAYQAEIQNPNPKEPNNSVAQNPAPAATAKEEGVRMKDEGNRAASAAGPTPAAAPAPSAANSQPPTVKQPAAPVQPSNSSTPSVPLPANNQQPIPITPQAAPVAATQPTPTQAVPEPAAK